MKLFPVRGALFLLIATASLAHAQTCKVSLHVDGFRNHDGRMGVIVFRNSEGWPEDLGKALFHDNYPITGDHVTVELSLPEGRYAIAVLHDENSNHKLDRNFLGIPREGFGFTNNPKVRLTAPNFDTAAMGLSCPATEVSIHLIYK
jgi:uncharacterized protein (DUF2141 family)